MTPLQFFLKFVGFFQDQKENSETNPNLKEGQHEDCEPSTDLLDSNQKNAKTIYCAVCGSKVLLPGVGVLVKRPVSLFKQKHGVYLIFFWTDFSSFHCKEKRLRSSIRRRRDFTVFLASESASRV